MTRWRRLWPFLPRLKTDGYYYTSLSRPGCCSSQSLYPLSSLFSSLRKSWKRANPPSFPCAELPVIRDGDRSTPPDPFFLFRFPRNMNRIPFIFSKAEATHVLSLKRVPTGDIPFSLQITASFLTDI